MFATGDSGHVEEHNAILATSVLGRRHLTADGSTDDAAALAAAIAATPVGGVLDCAGLAVALGASVTVGKRMTIIGGAFTSALTRCLLVTADDVQIRGSSFTRTGGTGADNNSAVTWNAGNGRLTDVSTVSAVGPGLHLQAGGCNGMTVDNGYYECQGQGDAILLQPGAHNYNVTVDGATIRNTGTGSGIAFYNASQCLVTRCDIEGIRRSPLLTVGGTWDNTSGDVWRIALAAHRTDIEPNAVYADGVEIVKQRTGDLTTPPADRYTTPGDGYLYLNLGGTNPNTVAVTTTRTNGYGVLFYASPTEDVGMSDNMISFNRIDDCDNSGIYYQLLMNTPRRNRTLCNTITNTCLEGVTVADLPVGAIAAFGGVETHFAGDDIDGVGAIGKTAYGVRFKRGEGNPIARATLSGVTVRSVHGYGVGVSVGTYRLFGCSVTGCTDDGITAARPQNGGSCAVELFGCDIEDVTLSAAGTTQTFDYFAAGGSLGTVTVPA